jgi:hypothetical protein
MAFVRLFPIDATYARESDRTFSERLLKQSTAAVATSQDGHRSPSHNDPVDAAL